MEDNIGNRIAEKRKALGLTQQQLADKCRLNIRSIQRIESGSVTPRMFTLEIINEALGTEFKYSLTKDQSDAEIKLYRKIFQQRKRIRLGIMVIFISLLIMLLGLAFRSWNLFGMPKQVWAPFVYGIFFILLIAIGLTWRCPACNGLLGDVFNTRYCSKCGLKFYD